MNNVVITVDVETDWGGRLKPTKETMRGIFDGLDIILELLHDFKVPATFFISSEVVQESGAQLKKIATMGNEIASHAHSHCKLDVLPKEKFRNQIKKSIDILQENFGQRVLGFRAPQFRLNDYHFEVLYDLNIKYDSSVVPAIFPGRYQNILAPQNPYFKNSILEIPVSTFSVLKIPLGLLWVNLFGSNFNKFFILKNYPIVFYFHLFDILPEKNGGEQFGWVVNQWYRIKQKNVLDTLRNFIATNSKNQTPFVKMIDLCQSYQ